MSMQLFNDHNVYILGAGFSAHRGLPLISQFMRRMRDAHEYLVANHRHEEASAIETVLQFRLRSAAAAYRVQLDLENIEQLFSLASIAGDRYSEAIRTAIAATIDYSELTRPAPTSSIRIDYEGQLELTLPALWQQKSSAPNPPRTVLDILAPFYQVATQALLGLLGKSTGTARNTFIPFNYDLLVEKALSELGHEFSYGFAAEQQIQLLNPQTTLRHQPTALVRLLKLHGSMNWAVRAESTAVTIGADYGALRAASLIPELVPPTWRKSFTPALQSVWAGAVDAIREATRLIVVGFSAPPADLHFKYLLAAGLQDNVSIRDIVFFDPAEQAIRDRAQALFADLQRQPTVEIFDRALENLISNGTGRGSLADYGRGFSPQVQSVHNPQP